MSKEKRTVKLFYSKDGGPIRFGTKIERNSLCPCGSGKKYKKCRMQSDACQKCKECGQTMKLFQRRADGSLVFCVRGLHEKTGRDAEMKLLQKVDGQVVTLTQQISCVSREIAMRQRCYPRWISGGTMTQAKADEETRNMTAVLQTLKEVQEESSDKGIGL